ncbi:MAG: PRC-barrel domain-containing protein [Proteobacteria bacterium]|nr:PRC-barrel domain-containing protein [Pseudomonadota bacterium]
MAEQQANRTNPLIGLQVFDLTGRKLGHIEGVKLHVDTGEIDQVTVEDDGLLGFRKRRFSVAWPMLSYSETRHALVFAPGVHSDHEEHLPPPEARSEPTDRVHWPHL